MSAYTILAITVLRETLTCARSHDPDSRILGNVRAGDMAEALAVAISMMEPDPNDISPSERAHCEGAVAVVFANDPEFSDVHVNRMTKMRDLLLRERESARQDEIANALDDRADLVSQLGDRAAYNKAVDDLLKHLDITLGHPTEFSETGVLMRRVREARGGR